ncbi:phage tail protein [Mongoliitalea daihaiensis]|uniref:phage tail protein n=1 Tax=Mongoliitalea daihaiensis TaxID=2782006 RepID=UPI001F168AAF|nr:phage tail protein [Mongoliitalea daihaiensis]UJP63797.1 phage tail protein [Mongoliitalea daihaiensis]
MTYYPPVAFHFKVEFSGISEQQLDVEFQSIAGLTSELELEEISEGGENRFKHTLPIKSKYSNLILRRGIVVDSKLIQWCQRALEDFEFSPVDLTVKLLNEKHEPLLSWSVVHAIPVKWEVAEFNSLESKVMMETLELSYNYFKIIKL